MHTQAAMGEVVDLASDDDASEPVAKPAKGYRISRKEVVEQTPSAARPLGTVVAFTMAKRADGVRGRCIAIFTAQEQRLVRLCTQEGTAAPFWDPSLVEGINLGVQVEYEPCAGLPTLYPHKTEDLFVSGLKPSSTGTRTTVFNLVRLLAPHAKSPLNDVWPPPFFVPKAKRPCVLAGAPVPSLTAVHGLISAVDDENGLATVRTECGMRLPHVKINCNSLRALLRQTPSGEPSPALNKPLLLLLGLARAKPPSTTCLVLLVGGYNVSTAPRATAPPSRTLKSQAASQVQLRVLQGSSSLAASWPARAGTGRKTLIPPPSSDSEDSDGSVPLSKRARLKVTEASSTAQAGGSTAGPGAAAASRSARQAHSEEAHVVGFNGLAHRAVALKQTSKLHMRRASTSHGSGGGGGGGGSGGRSRGGSGGSSNGGGSSTVRESDEKEASVGTTAASAELDVGIRVLIGVGETRLEARPELNGREGIVVEFKPGSGRYHVRVPGDGGAEQTIALKPDVLQRKGGDGSPRQRTHAMVEAGLAPSVPGDEGPSRGQHETGSAQMAGAEADGLGAAEAEEADEYEPEELFADAFTDGSPDDQEDIPVGNALVGRRVRVWWFGDGDDVTYDGVVKSFSRTRGHTVLYTDGELRYHHLDDEDDEVWRLV